MSSSTPLPDYELDDLRVVNSRRELRAMADPLRGTLLDLLLERAATVGELATAVGRPKSTVAYHVGVLVDAGMLKVVRTRRVRAIDERFYGRTARVFQVGALAPEDRPVPFDNLSQAATEAAATLSAAAAEAAPAHEADDVVAIVRHARIPRDRAAEFWRRVLALTQEFTQLPRAGGTVYGFVAGLYPTAYPTLPDAPDAG